MRPYLRAANVFDGYIDTADVKSMNFSTSEYQRYRLQDGDILLNEGHSRELSWDGAPFSEERCRTRVFRTRSIRLRPGPSILESVRASVFSVLHVHAGRFAAVAKQTTSIAHLGVQTLADLPDASSPARTGSLNSPGACRRSIRRCQLPQTERNAYGY